MAKADVGPKVQASSVSFILLYHILLGVLAARGLAEMPTTDALAVVPPHKLYVLTKGCSHKGRLYSWLRHTQQTNQSYVGLISMAHWPPLVRCQYTNCGKTIAQRMNVKSSALSLKTKERPELV